jgi:DNA-binding transcriptional LysR family regulator
VVEDERVESVRLRTERVLFVASLSHPLARRTEVYPEDLTGQTLLLTEAGCAYRKKLDTMLALKHIRPVSVTEFNSVEAIKGCTALEMGIALLPEIVVAAEIKRGKLIAIDWRGPAMDIATHIVWHKDKWLSPAMRAFVDTVCRALGPDADADDDQHGAARMQVLAGNR